MADNLDDILKEIQAQSEEQLSSVGAISKSIPDQSAGLKDVSSHEDPPKTSSPSPLTMDISMSGLGGVNQISRQMLGGGSVVSDRGATPGKVYEGLSVRQRSLPRLSFRMLGSIAAVMVLTIGLGSAVFLSQQQQDIRQYAADPLERMDPSLEQYRADPQLGVTQEEEPTQIIDQVESEQMAQTTLEQSVVPWWQDSFFIGGVAVVISALLILGVFLHWLWAV